MANSIKKSIVILFCLLFTPVSTVFAMSPEAGIRYQNMLLLLVPMNIALLFGFTTIFLVFFYPRVVSPVQILLASLVISSIVTIVYIPAYFWTSLYVGSQQINQLISSTVMYLFIIYGNPIAWFLYIIAGGLVYLVQKKILKLQSFPLWHTGVILAAVFHISTLSVVIVTFIIAGLR